MGTYYVHARVYGMCVCMLKARQGYFRIYLAALFIAKMKRDKETKKARKLRKKFSYT